MFGLDSSEIEPYKAGVYEFIITYKFATSEWKVVNYSVLHYE